MEKTSFVLTQQLGHLKKSLKNKRNSEIWEQSIQFYRNNQSNLTSYHILKIIKIAFKSIRSTITKNCRYLSKLAIRFSKRGDDLKMQEQIEDQKNALNKKVKVLLNLLDCYTLTIQAVLFSYDSSYFNMMHRHDYHAFHSNKQLIFQSASLENEVVLTDQMLEHEMSGYFHFVCQATILYATSLLCCAENITLVQFFRDVDLKLLPLWSSSSQFCRSKLKYQCIKMNFIVKNPDLKLTLQYQIPLEILHSLDRYYRKWQAKQVKNLCRLLTRYLFLSLLNSGNPQLFFHSSLYKINPYINAFTEIYIFMKEMRRIYQYINYKIPNAFSKYFLEFMTAFIESYQNKLNEMQFLRELLTPYFPYAQLTSMSPGRNFYVSPEISEEICIPRLTNQQENSKAKVENWRSRIVSRQSSNATQKPQQSKVGVVIRLDLVTRQLKDSIFNYIDESDSNEDDTAIQQFEQQRLREIREIEARIYASKMKRRQNQENFHDFMPKCEVEHKLTQLQYKNIQLWEKTTEAKQQLSNKRNCEGLGKRLQIIEEESSIIHSPPPVKIECNPTELRRLSNSKKEKHQLKWGQVKLGNVHHKKKQEPVFRKQYQSICLSDKYDSMSQNLLLRNTAQHNNHALYNI